jgi:hypothetical protein
MVDDRIQRCNLGIELDGGVLMPEFHDVLVTSPVGFFKYADASCAAFDESRGTVTLLTDVHIHVRLLPHDEYAITSRTLGQTIHATFVGPDHAIPGALVFRAMPRRASRAYGRI